MDNLTTRNKAFELHQKILVSANLAQQNLWDMCTSLKEMRDGKFYKELGYSNFEDYCETEIGFSRINAYRYISIVENINPENVTSMLQIGMTKLSLLATISHEEQAEISDKLDLENTTVKELKAEINSLKQEKIFNQSKLSDSEFHRLDAENRLKGVREHNALLEQQLRNEKGKNKELSFKIEELENRPIEVAVAEPSDNERVLRETIKSLERENMRHYDELEAQYREDEKAVRAMLEREKQEALDQLTEDYEQQLSELKEKLANNESSNIEADADKEAFALCVSIARKMLDRVNFYCKKHREDDEYHFYVEKLRELKEILN
ncbi:MAG: hypothetical protein U0L20_06450 [Ruminococcus sp.]|nr:hypothetical protein [Ruminococcus sp.]